MVDAACRGQRGFFPPSGKGENVKRRILATKLICRECPVEVTCREYGLWEEFGVWGGTSENERRALRKARGYHE